MKKITAAEHRRISSLSSASPRTCRFHLRLAVARYDAAAENRKTEQRAQEALRRERERTKRTVRWDGLSLWGATTPPAPIDNRERHARAQQKRADVVRFDARTSLALALSNKPRVRGGPRRPQGG